VKYALLSLLLLAGCGSHTAWQASSGTPNAGANVRVDGGSGLAMLFGLTILAAGAYEATRAGWDAGSSQRPPDMAPDRRVSEQDCTKPIDFSLGNIRCK
jgi:hypothetical protein